MSQNPNNQKANHNKAHLAIQKAMVELLPEIKHKKNQPGKVTYQGLIDASNLEHIQSLLATIPQSKKIGLEIIDISYLGGNSILEYTLNTQSSNGLTQEIDTLLSQFQTDSKKLKADKLTSKYLGKKGLINDLTKIIPSLPKQARGEAGKSINALKQKISHQISDQKTTTSDSPTTKWLDVTAPGAQPTKGHLHPVTQAIEEITNIFQSIGFTRVRYPEVDWDWYAFESLNMPKTHPARDEWETFFIDLPIDKKMGKVVLTPHTSNGQVREMHRLKTSPIRMINIAKCYRRQSDVTHIPMFHQFEGLVVDKGINIQHLKGTIDYFAKHFFGPTAKSRIRPFHFQFTEPSFEVDFSCTVCEGKGCKYCKSGWHEVGGAGMVHPNVLKDGGIDPDIYTGFAFGWGVERAYTLKPGLKIDDIRYFYNNKLQFLNQF